MRLLIILCLVLLVSCSLTLPPEVPYGVPSHRLINNGGMAFEIGSNDPFTGITIEYRENSQIKEKISTLNSILIFIISLIALILILDTFKNPISTLIPNINFLLESLYETFKDIILFFKDLF